MSNRWQQTSLRRLIYLIRKEQHNSHEAYIEAKRQLTRYFEQPKQISLPVSKVKRYQEDIIVDTIEILRREYPNFRGNSRAYIKYTRKVLLTACAPYLKWDVEKTSLDETRFQDGEDTRKEMLAQSLFQDEAVHFQLDGVLAESDSAELISRVWKNLPSKHRRLLDARLDQQRPLKEIANTLGMSDAAVRVEVRRAVNQLLRGLMQAMAANAPKTSIKQQIAQLPEPDKTIVRGWWDGSSWRKIGQHLSPPLNQSETKAKFVAALLKLFYLLEGSGGYVN